MALIFNKNKTGTAFDFFEEGTLVVDEIHNISSLEPYSLQHDYFILNNTFEIHTEPNKMGTKLIEGTDYVGENRASEGFPATFDFEDIIYTAISIINPLHHRKDLYITYKAIGDISQELRQTAMLYPEPVTRDPENNLGPEDINVNIDKSVDFKYMNSYPQYFKCRIRWTGGTLNSGEAGRLRLFNSSARDLGAGESGPNQNSDITTTINGINLDKWIGQGEGDLKLVKTSHPGLKNTWETDNGLGIPWDWGTFGNTNALSFIKYTNGLMHIIHSGAMSDKFQILTGVTNSMSSTNHIYRWDN